MHLFRSFLFAFAAFVMAVYLYLTESRDLISMQDISKVDSSRDLVVISAHGENVSWIKEIPESLEVRVYQSSDPSGQFYVQNYCYEGGKYLEAILDVYDTASIYTKILFLHGHLRAKHNLGKTALEIIKEWEDWSPHYRYIAFPTKRTQKILHNKMWTTRFKLLKELQSEYPGNLRKIPQRFESACCAQFGVNREAIVQYPKEFWKSALRICYNNRNPGFRSKVDTMYGKNTAVAFERFWKVLFAPDCEPKEIFLCK